MLNPPEILSEEDLLQKARTELNETEKTRTAGLIELRSLIEADESEDYDRTDDAFLLRFLRCRKFDVEAAHENFKNYFEFRRQYPQFFQGTAESCKEFMESGMNVILSQRLRTGEAGLVLIPEKQDLDRFSFEQMMQTSVYTTEVLLQSVETQVCGVVILEDLNGFRLMDAMKQTKTEREISFKFLQECVPMRLKGIHIINAPWYVRGLIALVRPFMKKKMRERFYVHGADKSKLVQMFGAPALPRDFGGDHETDAKKWIRDQIAIEEDIAKDEIGVQHVDLDVQ